MQRARAARLVGLLLLGFTILSLAHYLSVELSLLTRDGIASPLEFVAGQELRMRIGIVHDVLIFVLVAVIGVALYLSLRRFGQGLAMVALACMVIESAVSMVIELSSFAALLLASDAEYLHGATQGQRHALLGLVLDTRAAGYAITILMYAGSSAIFSYLLLRSRYVPSILALSGLLASAGLFGATTIGILSPGASETLVGVASGLMMLFQVTVAVWLVTKGVRPGPAPAAPG